VFGEPILHPVLGVATSDFTPCQALTVTDIIKIEGIFPTIQGTSGASPCPPRKAYDKSAENCSVIRVAIMTACPQAAGPSSAGHGSSVSLRVPVLGTLQVCFKGIIWNKAL
jgi:hypothetical protein